MCLASALDTHSPSLMGAFSEAALVIFSIFSINSTIQAGLALTIFLVRGRQSIWDFFFHKVCAKFQPQRVLTLD